MLDYTTKIKRQIYEKKVYFMGNFKRIVSLTLLILLVITLVMPNVSMANETAVNLRTADGFALLAV